MKKTYNNQAEGKKSTRVLKHIPLRYIIAILLSLLEVAAVVAIVFALCYYVPYFYLAAFATEIFCVIKIIASDDNPEYKVPWLLVVLILPIVGFMLYFLFYSRRLDRRLAKRIEQLDGDGYEYDDGAAYASLEAEDITAANQARMLKRISGSALFAGDAVEYFPSGEAKHKRLIEDLKSAEKFIFLEYFIIEEGIFWNSILDVLKQKAQAGVDVRVIYDDMGCMMTLPSDYYKTLGRYGIKATPFAILKGNADSEFNNRSHRKIAVIDGRVGYTGDINIADEYINAIVKHGYWKDVAVRVEGNSVMELTRLFLNDFGMNVRHLPKREHDCYPEQKANGSGYVIPFGDGPAPLYDNRVGKSVIMDMISDARRYIYITTPYLIIDDDMCTCLESAALSGVDVRIVLPGIPDKKIVLELSRSFYRRLMKAGVRIYEYTPGFIHAKTYVCDDKYAMVGTINMDYRSLVHNFECGMWMYNVPCISDIKKDVLEVLNVSLEITDRMNDVHLIRRFVRAAGRVFATLM